MSKLLITLVLAIVILDLLVETVDARHGCPRRTSTCRSVCKRKGYNTGYCRGYMCRCIGKVIKCNTFTCKRYCSRRGYLSGYCIGSKCRCTGKVTKCNTITCKRYCSRRGYLSGYCIGNKCRCYGRKG